MNAKVSAVIPAYNAEGTILSVIKALKEQHYPLEAITLVDDGSTDQTVSIAKEQGINVRELDGRRGRGYVRAVAMECSIGAFVLSCDVHNYIGPDFLKQTMPHFEDPRVSAVYGSIRDLAPKTVGDRWRAFHLYRQDEPVPLMEKDYINTGAVVLRREAVMAVGNFDKACVMHEDFDLGQKLRQAGWKIIHDPNLLVSPLSSNTVKQVLDRYIRWNASTGKHFSLKDYMRHVWHSLKVMAWRDLKRHDIPCALVSLVCPHYQVMKVLLRRV